MLDKGGLAKGYHDKPSLPAHLNFYLDAFFDLRSDRSDGGVIPFGVLDRYATRHGIDDAEEFARFKHLVRVLDNLDFGIALETAQQRAAMDAPAGKRKTL